MRKEIFRKCLAMGAAAVMTTAMLSTAVFADDEIVVGGIFNVTGDQSTLDDPSQKGFDLAIEEINEAGGVNGKQLKAVYYDGQTDTAVCANNAKKLIDSDGAVVLTGFSDSDFVYAAGAVAQEAGVPFLSTGATTPDIPAVVGDCAFLTAFGDDVCAEACADYAFEELGATTAYVLTDNSMSYTTNLSDYFMAHFEELGGEIVLQDFFASGDYDYSAQIARYQDLGEECGILFMATGPDDASTVIEQFRSKGVKAPMISGDGWDTDLWGVAGDLANQDIYCGTHFSADDEGENVQGFIAAYTEKYGKAPENGFAALGYDAAHIIAAAIEACGDDVTPENIRASIEGTTDFEGVTGTISFTADEHVPDKTVVICQAEDGMLKFRKNI